MARLEIDEMRMLIQCAADGVALLNAGFGKDGDWRYALSFLPNKNWQEQETVRGDDPDMFYTMLSLAYAGFTPSDTSKMMFGKGRKKIIPQALDIIESKLSCESLFDSDLSARVRHLSVMDDEDIREQFHARFEVAPANILELPADRSIFWAKINHGYWEYMRAAYDDDRKGEPRFRDVDRKTLCRRLRKSGNTQFWGYQIARHFSASALHGKEKKYVSFGISLTAGHESPYRSINKKLNVGTRGAAVGMLSMFDTAMPNSSRYKVVDGGGARELIVGKKLGSFYEKYIAGTDACLFIVPPHLKQIGLVGYRGNTYKFIVPPTRLNENWKTVVATLVGYLEDLKGKHRSITILAQGASIASLMALMLADMDVQEGTQVRFFDLGRALDVMSPETLSKQAWATSRLEEYVAEGNKIFHMDGDVDFSLASPIL
jgi:hypothetical protein